MGQREACNRCRAPKPIEMAYPYVAPGVAIHDGRRPGAPVPGVDGNWMCPSCQNVNFSTRGVCNRCQEQKPPEAPFGGKGGGKLGGRGDWQCPICDSLNYASRTECSRCTFAKFKPSESGGYP